MASKWPRTSRSRLAYNCASCLFRPHPARTFTTSRQVRSIAAPEIDFTQPPPPPPSLPPSDQSLPPPSTKYARLVPESPSYFTSTPSFTDHLITLSSLLRTYQTIPTVAPIAAPRVAWKRLSQYRISVAENVGAAKYSKIVDLLKRLNRIHPALMPEPVKEAIARHRSDYIPGSSSWKPGFIDGCGRAYGAGRRKSSTARAYLVEGEGEVLVNGKSLTQAFARIHDRESAIWPLKVTGRVGKYNVWALVKGGGTTGQAESITLAVARALMVFEPALKPALRRAGCVTRDPRRVERKKPGHVKARKMPAWVKR